MYKLMATLLLLLPPSLVANQTGDWKAFASKDGGYEVQLPGVPLEQRQSIKTSVGTVYVVLAVLELKKGDSNNVFLVGYAEQPEVVVKSDTEEKRLDNARNGAVSNVRGKLKAEKQIKIDTHNGRELDIETDARNMVRFRFYFVNDRLYQVMVSGSREMVTGADAKKFLDSFKLVK